MLRRLEKRILVDLPSLEARGAMLKQYLPPVIHSVQGSVEIKSQIDYEQLAKVHVLVSPFMKTLKASSSQYAIESLSWIFLALNLSNALSFSCYKLVWHRSVFET